LVQKVTLLKTMAVQLHCVIEKGFSESEKKEFSPSAVWVKYRKGTPVLILDVDFQMILKRARQMLLYLKIEHASSLATNTAGTNHLCPIDNDVITSRWVKGPISLPIRVSCQNFVYMFIYLVLLKGFVLCPDQTQKRQKAPVKRLCRTRQRSMVSNKDQRPPAPSGFVA